MDIDKDYPACEQPSEFSIRWQDVRIVDEVPTRVMLSADEREATSGCSDATAAFAVLYPDFESLDTFRERRLKEIAAEPAE